MASVVFLGEMSERSKWVSKVRDIAHILRDICDVLRERSRDLQDLCAKVTRVEHMLERVCNDNVYCVRCQCKGHTLNECPVLDTTSSQGSDNTLLSQGSAPGSDILRGCPQEYDLWATSDNETEQRGDETQQFVDVVDIPKGLEQEIVQRRRDKLMKRKRLFKE